MTSKQKSLEAFAQERRMKDCKVCALAPEILQQLTEAARKKVPFAVQVEWLQTEIGAEVTGTELSRHRAARHGIYV